MSFTGSSPLSAVLTDSRGYALSSSTPIPVNPAEAGAANFATLQRTLNVTFTQFYSARATRRAILVTNTSASITAYLGDATVTALTGHALPPGCSVVLPITTALYGITAASTALITAIEVYD